jgi:hypothetical protein
MVSMTLSLHFSQRASDTIHSGSLPFLCHLDGLNLVGLVELFVTLLPDAVRYSALWESSISSPPLWARSIRPLPDTVLTRLFLTVVFTFIYTLQSTSARPPSDRVHTVLFLMVTLTFLLAEAARCGALCKSSWLHPATV